MVDDVTDNLRIRTKTNRLDDDIDSAYLALIHQLRKSELSVEAYHKQCLDYFSNCLAGGRFASLAKEAMGQDEELELLRRHLDDKRYTVLLYKVLDGQVHPPHHHHNVISTQIIVEGKIRLREYDRISRDADGNLKLKLVSDRTLLPGDWFQASEWKRNVHWFQAVEGPALIFNTNARGFEKETFDSEENGGFGRRYIDPTQFQEDHTIIGEEFDGEEATARFSGKALEEFAVPQEVL